MQLLLLWRLWDMQRTSFWAYFSEMFYLDKPLKIVLIYYIYYSQPVFQSIEPICSNDNTAFWQLNDKTSGLVVLNKKIIFYLLLRCVSVKRTWRARCENVKPVKIARQNRKFDLFGRQLAGPQKRVLQQLVHVLFRSNFNLVFLRFCLFGVYKF